MEEVYCKNCKREIAAVNYVLHSAHCERNIQLCSVCSEPVLRKEMEEHMENSHSLDACPNCSIEVEKWQLEKHKESCPKQPVKCKYCELEVPADGIELHIAACGARTDKCSICDKYVMLRHIESHKQNCKKERNSKQLVKCKICAVGIPANFLEEHIAACGSRTDECSMCHTYIKLRNMESHRRNCEKVQTSKFSTCRYCGEKVGFDTIDHHASICKSRSTKCRNCGEVYGTTTNHVCHKDTETAEIFTCEYCQDEVLSTIFDSHVYVCKSKSKRCPVCGETVKRYLDNHDCKKVPKTILKCQYCDLSVSSDIFEDHVNLCGKSIKKCKICNDSFQRKNEDQHSCKKSPSKSKGVCSICNEEISYMDFNVHVSACAFASGRNLPTDSDFKERKIEAIQLSSPVQKNFADIRSTKMIKKAPSSNPYQECEFCKEKLPDLIYTTHISQCPKRLHKCKACSEFVPFLKRRPEDHDCQGSSSYDEKHDTHNTIHSKNFTKSLYKCELCYDTVPENQRRKHEKTECKAIHANENESSVVHSYKPTEHRSLYTAVATISKSPYEDSLVKESKNCSQCSYKIPLDRYEDHVKYCSTQKKMCNFCKEVIHIEEEDFHLRYCINKKQIEADGNKGKKKKKNEDKTGSLFDGFCGWMKKVANSSPENNYGASNYDTVQNDLYDPGDGIPCEFCNQIYPFFQIIEHQSGCRPDLARYERPEASGYTDLNASKFKEKDREKPYYMEHDSLKHTRNINDRSSNYSKYLTTSRETSQETSLPNQHTFPHMSSDGKKDLISKSNQKEENKPKQKLLFKYNGEKKDDFFVVGKGIIKQAHQNTNFTAGEFLSINSFPSQASSSTMEETVKTKSNRGSSSLELNHSDLMLKSKNINFTFNQELKAIGSEREQRKEIIQEDTNAVWNSIVKINEKTIDIDNYSQDESTGVEERTQSLNSDNATGSSEDLYLSCEEEEGFEDAKFSENNKGVADNDRNPRKKSAEFDIHSDEDNKNKVETFAYAFKEALNNNVSKYRKYNLTEHILVPEGEDDVDQKNKETFGSDCEADLDHGNYDYSNRYYLDSIKGKDVSKLSQWACNSTEDNFLGSHDLVLQDESESNQDNDMEAYFQFLDKDDTGLDSNNDTSNNEASAAKSCICGNIICLCAFNQQSTSSDDIGVVTLDDFIAKGARSKNGNHPSSFPLVEKVLDLKLESEQCASSNIESERRMLNVGKSTLNYSTEEKDNSSNWTKWRKQNTIDSDSE